MISAVIPRVPFQDRIFTVGFDIGGTVFKGMIGFQNQVREGMGSSGGSTGDEHGVGVFSEVKRMKVGEGEWKEKVCVGYRLDIEFQRWVACVYGEKAVEARGKFGNEDGYFFVSDIKQRVDEVKLDKVKLDKGKKGNHGPELIQILSDYFGYLKTAALNELLKRFASSGGVRVDVSLVQWCISIPSTWDHEQKQIIRMAAFEAGIIDLPSADTLVFCTDTDATLLGLKWTGELDAQIGNIVTVCDCGASITKISTMKILPGNSFMPFGKPTILEIGSESIDRELYARFQAHVGMDVFEEWTKESPQLISRINAQFKVLKQFFNLQKKSSDSCKKIKVQNKDVVLFTTSEAMEVMTLVVDQIVEGVKNHLNSIYSSMNQSSLPYNMKMVVAGGHARSHALTKGLVTLVSKPENLILPRQPSKSILHGLVYLSITPNAIRERASRFSYGTQFSKLYDPKTDDPTAYKWGSHPNQFIASFLPFTKAGTPIPSEKVFEQIVCPANDHQTEFPFGLYYSYLPSPKLKECVELVTLTVAIPEGYRYLGKENRFRILMEFGVTEIKFSVVHTQSGEIHESVVVL